MGELISVIIPVYNSEKYLNRCVESILNQTYSNLEIILVNDGSKDNSKDLCKEWEEKDKRVKFINKKNGGASSARNLGIEKANGEFIQFVDADDFIELDYIENLYEPFKKYKNIDLSVGGFVIDGLNEKIVYSPSKDNVYLKKEFNVKENFWSLVHGGFAFLDSPVNKLYRKSKIVRFNEKICISEDKAFNIECLKNIESLAIVRNSGYHYVMNGNSLSHRSYENLHLDLQTVDDLLIEYVHQYINGDSKEEINKIVMDTFLRCVRHYIAQNMDKKILVSKIKLMIDNKNFENALLYRSKLLKEKIFKKLIRKKRYLTFIKIYKLYINLKRINIEKI